MTQKVPIPMLNAVLVYNGTAVDHDKTMRMKLSCYSAINGKD